MKECAFCEKTFIPNHGKQKFCDSKCRSLYFYYQNREKKKAYQREYNHKAYDKNKARQKESMKIWYNNNKERQKKNVMRSYNRNKEKWAERRWIFDHRKEILDVLPKECFSCGKMPVKVIHHTTYLNLPRMRRGSGNEKENREILLEYSNKLLGFCSKECHRDHERKIRGISCTQIVTG